jgi:hypothetical protein
LDFDQDRNNSNFFTQNQYQEIINLAQGLSQQNLALQTVAKT